MVPMSGASSPSRFNPRVAITDKIQYAMSTAVSATTGPTSGGRSSYLAKENQLYMNVPVSGGEPAAVRDERHQQVVVQLHRLDGELPVDVQRPFSISVQTATSARHGIPAPMRGRTSSPTDFKPSMTLRGCDEGERGTLMRPTRLYQRSPLISAGLNYDFRHGQQHHAYFRFVRTTLTGRRTVGCRSLGWWSQSSEAMARCHGSGLLNRSCCVCRRQRTGSPMRVATDIATEVADPDDDRLTYC